MTYQNTTKGNSFARTRQTPRDPQCKNSLRKGVEKNTKQNDHGADHPKSPSHQSELEILIFRTEELEKGRKGTIQDGRDKSEPHHFERGEGGGMPQEGRGGGQISPAGCPRGPDGAVAGGRGGAGGSAGEAEARGGEE